MLFERQRLLLSLLDTLGEPVGAMDFQKLLFLYAQEFEEDPSYEFVPYLFGGFSFTSYADKRRLIDSGLLADDEQRWVLTDAGRKALAQKATRPARVGEFRDRYRVLRGKPLVAEVYRRFPYYATRSEILDQIVTDRKTRERIEAERSAPTAPGLLTVGYEGKSLEAYLNQLLRSGVTLLCDVRRNPISRKYGFSKRTLSHACQGVGIRYEHLPELGIASKKRQGLESQADYERLFAAYERGSLSRQGASLAKIHQWVAGGSRVALTCYELEPEKCHRRIVAKALSKQFGRALRAQHL